ncbi:MAG: hypothetical protein HKN85_02110 [Gammaproteobacteria bacterium]|nr:hypothetical protein [Gammaproteobacteria bacterium]
MVGFKITEEEIIELLISVPNFQLLLDALAAHPDIELIIEPSGTVH